MVYCDLTREFVQLNSSPSWEKNKQKIKIKQGGHACWKNWNNWKKIEKQALSEIQLEYLEKGTFSELEGWKNWKIIFKLKISTAKLASLSFLGLTVSLKNFLVEPSHYGSSKNHFRLPFIKKITKNL